LARIFFKGGEGKEATREKREFLLLGEGEKPNRAGRSTPPSVAKRKNRPASMGGGKKKKKREGKLKSSTVKWEREGLDKGTERSS